MAEQKNEGTAKKKPLNGQAQNNEKTKLVYQEFKYPDSKKDSWELYLAERTLLQQRYDDLQLEVGALDKSIKVETAEIDKLKKIGVEQESERFKKQSESIIALKMKLNEKKLLIKLAKELLDEGASLYKATDNKAGKPAKTPGITDLTIAISRTRLIIGHDIKCPSDAKVEKKYLEVTMELEGKIGPVTREFYTYAHNTYDRKEDGSYVLCDDMGTPYNHEQQIYSLSKDGRKLVSYNDFPMLKTIGYVVCAIALALAVAATFVLTFPGSVIATGVLLLIAAGAGVTGYRAAGSRKDDANLQHFVEALEAKHKTAAEPAKKTEDSVWTRMTHSIFGSGEKKPVQDKKDEQKDMKPSNPSV